MSTWQEVAATVANLAPVAGTAIGGPVGAGVGLAIKALAGAFGITSPNPQPQEVLKAIQSDPDAFLKVEQARASYEIEKMRLTLADIQSARQMGISGIKDKNIYIIAWLMISGFFGLLVFLLFVTVPAGQSDVVFMLFGALSTAFGSVITFFFGSSKGSQDKSVELTALLNKK